MNCSNITTFLAIMLHTTLQKEELCIETWIYRSMICYIHEEKVGLFFPHLITALCKKAKVPTGRSKWWLHPTMNTIGDSIYKYLIASHHKQVSDRKRTQV
ncbi:hypothetical protein ES332_A13G088400v1 [Gossypium tomentosum]|uniref:Uncharacterized protein n=1 Tax=Gossypium tomentosum TaxID=34277 RepID=A0A5D2MHU2_GOSTO|nr:hypothetical protein ES332_A13G088400v1 [Gossypium tomentosum]